MDEIQPTQLTQVCKTCCIEKPVSAYRNSRVAPHAPCTECNKCVESRRKPTSKRIVYNRERSRAHAHANKGRKRTGTAPRDPERLRARRLLMRAVRRGEVSRPSTCTKCGASEIPQGHHKDYARPFDVEWLCRSCHSKAHRKPDPEPTPPPPKRAYCKNGHELTPETTHYRAYGDSTYRRCNECSRLAAARRPYRKH